MYRFRDNACGYTLISLESVKNHLHKVGTVHTIRGYTYMTKHGPEQAVLIKGEKGTMRLNGLAWGYGGEGPAGLRFVLQRIGVGFDEIQRVLSRSWDDCETIGTKWQINMEYSVIGHA